MPTIKLEQPYQYNEDGKVIIEDMYRQKDEEKPTPTSQADFSKWLNVQRGKYLKE